MSDVRARSAGRDPVVLVERDQAARAAAVRGHPGDRCVVGAERRVLGVQDLLQERADDPAVAHGSDGLSRVGRDDSVDRLVNPRPERVGRHVCDQLVDWTKGRNGTFFDGPDVTHLSFADPYTPERFV